MPDKYFVDKRMLFFDRELMLNRIQKIMKGEVLAKEIEEPKVLTEEPKVMAEELNEPKVMAEEPLILEGPSIAEGANKPVIDNKEIVIDEIVEEPNVLPDTKGNKKRVTKKQPKNVVATDIPSTQLVITEKIYLIAYQRKRVIYVRLVHTI